MAIRCPICDTLFEPEQSPAMPFCCQRCRQVDLGRWLKEGYGLAVDNEEEPPEPPPTDDDR